MERIEELEFRIRMCEFCISLLERETNDPRQPDALNHYRGQLSELKNEYIKLHKPPDIVVHLKPAHLSADVPK